MQESELMNLAGSVAEPFGEDRQHSKEAELNILQSLRRIIRSAELHSKQLASTHQVTTPQLVCLSAIKEADGISSRTLASQVALSPSTLVGIIDRLEAKGLVERMRSVKDRRIIELHVTPAGSKLLLTAPSPLQERLSSNLAKISEAERAQIASSLDKLVLLMEVDQVDAEPMLEAGWNIRLTSDVNHVPSELETSGRKESDRA